MATTQQPAPGLILGLILAGGLARRMGGGDKGLRTLQGRPVLTHVIERLRPQVTELVLNANGDPARFAALKLAIVADDIPDRPGPLAGIVAGLDHAAGHGFDWLVSVPADAPLLPPDLVARLFAARDERAMAVAASGGRVHPIIALWPVSMRNHLRAMVAAGLRRVGGATEHAAIATWSDQPVDPFFNVNTADDLAIAQALVSGA